MPYTRGAMTPDERVLADLVRQLERIYTASSRKGAVKRLECPRFRGLPHLRRATRWLGAIEAGHRGIFVGIYNGSRNHYTVRGIRFPRPDVAIVLVEAHLQFSEHGQAREIQARPTLIVVKEAERWEIQMFQNTWGRPCLRDESIE